jgi:hypothetical protein
MVFGEISKKRILSSRGELDAPNSIKRYTLTGVATLGLSYTKRTPGLKTLKVLGLSWAQM